MSGIGTKFGYGSIVSPKESENKDGHVEGHTKGKGK